jgi:hypothetical protein
MVSVSAKKVKKIISCLCTLKLQLDPFRLSGWSRLFLVLVHNYTSYQEYSTNYSTLKMNDLPGSDDSNGTGAIVRGVARDCCATEA